MAVYVFYPFPVPDFTEATPPDMPEQTAYLFCITQRARLWTRGEKAVDKRVIDADLSLAISVHYGSGDVIGQIQLHDFDQLKRLMGASARSELGAQIEFVAINHMQTGGDTFIEEEQRRGLPQWTRDEYTVPWIEWTGLSVARRRSGVMRDEGILTNGKPRLPWPTPMGSEAEIANDDHQNDWL